MKNLIVAWKHLTNTSVNLSKMPYILTFDEDKISRER